MKPRSRQRGAMSLQMVVLLVPVMFGFMGFGIDLGRMYLVRGELNHAAEAMALSAAEKLIGTEASLTDATLAARLVLDNATGHGAKFNFGSVVIGESTGLLTSEAPEPSYFETAAAAIGEDSNATGGEAAGPTARHVRVDLRADAPLVFWAMLSLGQERRTSIAARAVAGISPPLCTACGILPIAIAAISQEDTTDFGFIPGTRYTLGFQCTGTPLPAPLPGTTARIPYLIFNRFNDTSPLEETQQLYRIGAQGLLPSTVAAQSCISISAEEIGWTTAAPLNCTQNAVPPAVRALTCGLAARFEVSPSDACQVVPDVNTLGGSYIPDNDVTDIEDYTTYAGNARRLMSVAIVDALAQSGPMIVLGFRQFLIEPNQNDVTITPADLNGRFGALYVGSVAPIREGRFDGCTQTAGPWKVVLHR